MISWTRSRWTRVDAVAFKTDASVITVEILTTHSWLDTLAGDGLALSPSTTVATILTGRPIYALTKRFTAARALWTVIRPRAIGRRDALIVSDIADKPLATSTISTTP